MERVLKASPFIWIGHHSNLNRTESCGLGVWAKPCETVEFHGQRTVGAHDECACASVFDVSMIRFETCNV